MIRWFGDLPFAHACQRDNRVATPVGVACAWCDEAIVAGDRGYYTSEPDAQPRHVECFLRMIVGSVAHQTHRCTCYGGTESDDDSSLSKRDDAIAAFIFADTFGQDWSAN